MAEVKMEICFLLLWFTVIPLAYAGCPTGMCCPVGDNCDVSNRLCKPNSAEDCRRVHISFNKGTYRKNEDRSPAEVCIKLKLNRPAPIKFKATVNDISYTATGGVDYDSGPYAITFRKGKKVAKVCFDIIDDKTWETDEIFGLEIDNASLPAGVVRSSPYKANVTLLDDEDSIIAFEQSTYNINEYDGVVICVLVLSQPLSTDVIINVIDIEGSAMRGSKDYISGPYAVKIPAGEYIVKFNVSIIVDNIIEPSEHFFLAINTSTLPNRVSVGGPYQVTVSIIEDGDATISFSQPVYSVNESSGLITLELLLSSQVSFEVAANVSWFQGNATRGIDHNFEQTFVTFPPGVTRVQFNVIIFDDDIPEGNEYLMLQIYVLTGALVGSPYYCVISIVDDDDTIITSVDILLCVSEETYAVYEHNGPVCLTLVLDKPAPFDFIVQIRTENFTATGIVDYDSGPYSVMFTKWDTAAILCVNITDDQLLEEDEIFGLIIDAASLPVGVDICENPYTTNVTILDNEYTLCFDQRSYAVREDEGLLVMSLRLSRVLPFDVYLKFVYQSYTAVGNDTAQEGIDYYTSIAFPNFDKIPAFTTRYTLNITIVADRILENNELFEITPQPSHLPIGHRATDCSVDVIIRDDDDIKLDFENQSYAVDNKDDPEIPAIRITYPTVYDPSRIFPIIIKIEIKDDTATEGMDYNSMNYTYMIKNHVERLELKLFPVDDDIVEADETYSLTIVLVDSHNRVVTGENKTTTITIYDDDVAYLTFDGSSLQFSKKLELPSSAIVNITYTDGQHNETTITPEEAIKQTYFPLPVYKVDISKIDVHFPSKFNSIKGPNVRPSSRFMDTICVHYDL